MLGAGQGEAANSSAAQARGCGAGSVLSTIESYVVANYADGGVDLVNFVIDGAVLVVIVVAAREAPGIGSVGAGVGVLSAGQREAANTYSAQARGCPNR